MTKVKSVTAPKKESPARLDKFCICFVPDSESLKVIGSIYLEMKKSYPDLISVGTGVGLPYHMTIIGGIKLDPGLSKALIKNAISQILPFGDSTKIPILKDVEPTQMNGNYLAIRLKFKDGSYVITGSPENNLGLASSMGAASFDFNLVRHVGVCRVKDGFSGMDKVKNLFDGLMSKYKPNLAVMTLTPKVFIMPAGQKTWRLYSLD